jgi:Family of unknown function (DUF6188)
LTIMIRKEDGLYSATATPPDSDADWTSSQPMTAKELFQSLVLVGCYPVDVWKAFQTCDPDLPMNSYYSFEGMDRDIDLRLDGKSVSRCCIDSAFSLEFLQNQAEAVIRITGQMKIKDSKTQLSLSGHKPILAAQASLLFGKTIEHAVGRKDGTLDVRFSDGSELVVPVDPDYEAWELVADNGFKVISLPGGKLAIWGPRKIRDKGSQ